MPERRIFISATNLDLKSYRLLASQAVRSRGFAADDEAIFNLTHLEINDVLERRIAVCDAVVCLIGVAHGSEPSGRPADAPRRSYSRIEHDVARRLGKPVILLRADEATPFDPHEAEPEELRSLQRAYRAEVIRDRDWRSFASADQLRLAIANLRFPWEGPPPNQKPNNIPFASIGSLFKGRDPFLTDLRAALDGRAVAVHGLGGVGKTRVAIEYAWRFANDYTALLFVSAPSGPGLRSNLAELLGPLGLAAPGLALEDRLAIALDGLNARPGWLLILDNVDTEEAAAEVHRLLPRLRSGHILMTSRQSNWRAGIKPVELDVLSEADAVVFLIERASHRILSADDEPAALAIAHELGGLALALEQSGAYIDKLRLTFSEYLAHWQSMRPAVLAWHDPNVMDYPVSVAVTWETTFALLTEPERFLLGVLSWLAPEPIPLFLFGATTLKAQFDDPRETLAGLSAYSLVRFEPSGNAVSVHRLVQEITRDRAAKSADGRSLRIALGAVHERASMEILDLRTWPVWTALAPHAGTVARHADAARLHWPTIPLMFALGKYLNTRSQFLEAEPLYRRALAIAEDVYEPDHDAIAVCLTSLAQLLHTASRYTEAEPLMRRALAIAERLHGPDRLEIAVCLNNLASLLHATNRRADAEPLMLRALAITERLRGPDHPDVATCLNNLVGLMLTSERLSEAEPLMRRALAIDERAYGRDHPMVANRLNNLGNVLRALNQLAAALPILDRALSIAERVLEPDHPFVGLCLSSKGQWLLARNLPSEAEPLMRRALSIAECVYKPDHPAVATDLNNLAALLHMMNRLAEAGPLYLRGLAILRRFRETTGREHPSWEQGIYNYRNFLQSLRLPEDEIDRRVCAVTESV